MQFVDVAMKSAPIACAIFPSDGEEYLRHQRPCAMMAAVEMGQPRCACDAARHELPEEPEPVRCGRLILSDDQIVHEVPKFVWMSINCFEQGCDRRGCRFFR